jgi:hypothetical protein
VATFGFIVDQNLDDVPLEFAVSPEWTPHMIALKDLERVLGNLKFPTELKKADQASTLLGKTVRRRRHRASQRRPTGGCGIDVITCRAITAPAKWSTTEIPTAPLEPPPTLGRDPGVNALIEDPSNGYADPMNGS